MVITSESWVAWFEKMFITQKHTRCIILNHAHLGLRDWFELFITITGYSRRECSQTSWVAWIMMSNRESWVAWFEKIFAHAKKYTRHIISNHVHSRMSDWFEFFKHNTHVTDAWLSVINEWHENLVSLSHLYYICYVFIQMKNIHKNYITLKINLKK